MWDPFPLSWSGGLTPNTNKHHDDIPSKLGRGGHKKVSHYE